VGVWALVGITALAVAEPLLAGSAKTTSSNLEVVEDMLHERGLSWQVCGAAMEVAGELRARSDRSLGLHRTPSSDNSVLFALHGLVEEEWVGSGHLSDGGVDWGEVGVFLGAVAIGTRAHVPILCGPVFEPVGADGAAGAVCCDLVKVKFDDEVSKGGEDVCAALLRAGEHGLAW
jgi:hypothetical protein